MFYIPKTHYEWIVMMTVEVLVPYSV